MWDHPSYPCSSSVSLEGSHLKCIFYLFLLLTYEHNVNWFLWGFFLVFLTSRETKHVRGDNLCVFWDLRSVDSIESKSPVASFLAFILPLLMPLSSLGERNFPSSKKNWKIFDFKWWICYAEKFGQKKTFKNCVYLYKNFISFSFLRF